MSSSRPVIYLAFADDPDDRLDQLKDERQGIVDALKAVREAVDVEHEPNVTVERMSEQVKDFGSRLVVFHYGGHADDGKLRLEGGGGYVRGLALTLGELPNVRLVFLNGCSTEGLIAELFDAGVPAVIATSAPIGDVRAKTLAVSFYAALAHPGRQKLGGLLGGRSIREALKEARKELTSRHADSDIVVEEYRGVGPSTGSTTAPAPIEDWTLYWKRPGRTFWERLRALDFSLPWVSPVDWRLPRRAAPSVWPLALVLAAALYVLLTVWMPGLWPFWVLAPSAVVVALSLTQPLLLARKIRAAAGLVTVVTLVLAIYTAQRHHGATVLRLVFPPATFVDLRDVAQAVQIEIGGRTFQTSIPSGTGTALIGGGNLKDLYRQAFSDTLSEDLLGEASSVDQEFASIYREDNYRLALESEPNPLGTRPIKTGAATSATATLGTDATDTWTCSLDLPGDTARVARWFPRVNIRHCFLWKLGP